MPKRKHTLVTLAPDPAPALPGPVAGEDSKPQGTLPVMRFFGVPFLKGTAGQVTSIHLCPAVVHLAAIRDGSELAVYNRHTLQRIDLGGNESARRIAFRPKRADEERIEMAIVGPLDQPHILRRDLADGGALSSLPFAGATAVAYSGDGAFLAAGDARGRVRVWHLGGRNPEAVLEASLGAQVECLVFHAEHPTLYGILADGSLAEMPLAPSPAAPVREALRDRAPGVAFRHVAAGRGGFALYVAGDDERVYVADTATGEVAVFSPGVGPIQGLQVLPASGLLCVVGEHAVYVLGAVGARTEDHQALLCPFQERVYAAWELSGDALLVFHAGERAA